MDGIVVNTRSIQMEGAEDSRHIIGDSSKASLEHLFVLLTSNLPLKRQTKASILFKFEESFENTKKVFCKTPADVLAWP
jgi:hypothetical protein